MPMMQKLTLSIHDAISRGYQAVIGRGSIGKSLGALARPFVTTRRLNAAYAEMSADKERNAEADAWCESLE
jgi:hypothetical protein